MLCSEAFLRRLFFSLSSICFPVILNSRALIYPGAFICRFTRLLSTFPFARARFLRQRLSTSFIEHTHTHKCFGFLLLISTITGDWAYCHPSVGIVTMRQQRKRSYWLPSRTLPWYDLPSCQSRAIAEIWCTYSYRMVVFGILWIRWFTD